MKTILLIRPRSTTETFWNLTGLLSLTGKKAVIPPISLATLAALTPEEYRVIISDEEVEDIDYDMECDLVGITGFTIHKKRMFDVAREFRSRGRLVVAGGPFASEHTDECGDHFDVIISGEAERIWGEFLQDWTRGDYKKIYKDPETVDMAITPAPRWDLLDLDDYSGGMVQTSRGCPHDCEFCNVVSLFGRKMRLKPIDHVISEIKKLTEMGKYDIFISDDNFIGNRRYARELLAEIIKLKKKLPKTIRFMTQLTLNVAEEEDLLDLLTEANFYCFFIGIETPNKDSLNSINKGHNAKLDLLSSIKKIHSRGIFIISGMIVGIDSDDSGIFDAQLDFLSKAGLTLPMLGMLIALKGTRLWNRLESEGRLLADLEAGDMFAVTNVIPKLMGKEELEREYKILLKRVYSPEEFLIRFQNLIEQIDVKRAWKLSPLLEQLKPVNFQLYYALTTFRVLSHYLFNKDRDIRIMFRKAMKIVFKKGRISFPWLIEHFLYFKALNDFVSGLEIDETDDSLLEMEIREKVLVP
ncbi:MAG: B12-binding domain-containing radical SAM protein [Spirochaetes bacterium]|jgi:radical SAM superfamily enzyme YgiQ (UPF0313 family)|nr:B12-binding domain-containing radical SAM protein [Spirochaetota bacterium]